MGSGNSQGRIQPIAYQKDMLGACWNSPLQEWESTYYIPSRWIGISQGTMDLHTGNQCFVLRAYEVQSQNDTVSAAAATAAVTTVAGSVGGGGGAAQSSPVSVASGTSGGKRQRQASRKEETGDGVVTNESFTTMKVKKTTKKRAPTQENLAGLAADKASGAASPPPAASLFSTRRYYPSATDLSKLNADAASVGSASRAGAAERFSQGGRAAGGSFDRGSAQQRHASVTSIDPASSGASAGGATTASRTEAALRVRTKDLARGSNEAERVAHCQHPYLRASGLSVLKGVVFRVAPARRRYDRIVLSTQGTTRDPRLLQRKKTYGRLRAPSSPPGTAQRSGQDSPSRRSAGTPSNQSPVRRGQHRPGSSDNDNDGEDDNDHTGPPPMELPLTTMRETSDNFSDVQPSTSEPAFARSLPHGIEDTPDALRPMRSAPFGGGSVPVRGEGRSRSVMQLPFGRSPPRRTLSVLALRRRGDGGQMNSNNNNNSSSGNKDGGPGGRGGGQRSAAQGLVPEFLNPKTNFLSEEHNYTLAETEGFRPPRPLRVKPKKGKGKGKDSEGDAVYSSVPVAGELSYLTPPVVIGAISCQELQALPGNAEICLGGWLTVSLQDEQKRLRRCLELHEARRRAQEEDAAEAAALARRRHQSVENLTRFRSVPQPEKEGAHTPRSGRGDRLARSIDPSAVRRAMEQSMVTSNTEDLEAAGATLNNASILENSANTTVKGDGEEDKDKEGVEEEEEEEDYLVEKTTVESQHHDPVKDATGPQLSSSQLSQPPPPHQPLASTLPKEKNAVVLDFLNKIEVPVEAAKESTPPTSLVPPDSDKPASPTTPHGTALPGRQHRHNSPSRRRRSSSPSQQQQQQQPKEPEEWFPFHYIIVALPMYECSILPTTFHQTLLDAKPVSLNIANALSRSAYGVGCITGVRYGGMMVIEVRDVVHKYDNAWLTALASVGTENQRRNEWRDNDGDGGDGGGSSLSGGGGGGSPGNRRGNVNLSAAARRKRNDDTNMDNTLSLLQHIMRKDRVQHLMGLIRYKLRQSGVYVTVALTKSACHNMMRERRYRNLEDRRAAAAVNGNSSVPPQPPDFTFEDGTMAGEDDEADAWSDDSSLYGVEEGRSGKKKNRGDHHRSKKPARIFTAEQQQKRMEGITIRGTFRQIGGMRYIDATALMEGCPARTVVLGICRWVHNLLYMPVKARPLALYLQRYEGLAGSIRVVSRHLMNPIRAGGNSAPSFINSSFLGHVSGLGHGLGEKQSSMQRPVSPTISAAMEPNFSTLAGTTHMSFDTATTASDDGIYSPRNGSFNNNDTFTGAPKMAYTTLYTGPLDPVIRCVLSPEIEATMLACLRRNEVKAPGTAVGSENSDAASLSRGTDRAETVAGHDDRREEEEKEEETGSKKPLEEHPSDPIRAHNMITELASGTGAGTPANLSVGAPAATAPSARVTTPVAKTIESALNNHSAMENNSFILRGGPDPTLGAVPNASLDHHTAAMYNANSAMVNNSFTNHSIHTDGRDSPCSRGSPSLVNASFGKAAAAATKMAVPSLPQDTAAASPNAAAVEELSPEVMLADKELRALKDELEEIRFLVANARTQMEAVLEEYVSVGSLLLPHTRIDRLSLSMLFLKIMRLDPADIPLKELSADWIPVFSALASTPYWCTFGYEEAGAPTRAGGGVRQYTYSHQVRLEDVCDANKRRDIYNTSETTKYITYPRRNGDEGINQILKGTLYDRGGGGGDGETDPTGENDRYFKNIVVDSVMSELTIALVPYSLSTETRASLARAGMDPTGLSFIFTGGSFGVLAGLLRNTSAHVRDLFGRTFAAYRQERRRRQIYQELESEPGGDGNKVDGGKDAESASQLLQLRCGYNVFLQKLSVWGASQGSSHHQHHHHHRGHFSGSEDASDTGSGNRASVYAHALLHQNLDIDKHRAFTASIGGAGGGGAAGGAEGGGADDGGAVPISRYGVPFTSAEAFALFDAIIDYLHAFHEIETTFAEELDDGNNATTDGEAQASRRPGKRRSLLAQRLFSPGSGGGAAGGAAAELGDAGMHPRSLVRSFEISIATNYYYKTVLGQKDAAAAGAEASGSAFEAETTRTRLKSILTDFTNNSSEGKRSRKEMRQAALSVCNRVHDRVLRIADAERIYCGGEEEDPKASGTNLSASDRKSRGTDGKAKDTTTTTLEKGKVAITSGSLSPSALLAGTPFSSSSATAAARNYKEAKKTFKFLTTQLAKWKAANTTRTDAEREQKRRLASFIQITMS